MLRLAGGGLYLVGTVLVTMVRNVPMNNALAAVDPVSADGATQWARYVPGWTAWNSVRTVAAIAAAAMLSFALFAGRTGHLFDTLRSHLTGGHKRLNTMMKRSPVRGAGRANGTVPFARACPAMASHKPGPWALYGAR